jgi:hypothetical protein
MSIYNIKREAEVYIVQTNGTRTRLDVTPDINFTQTFTDETYPQKTLHEQHKLHDASNIKKANPANFNFTIPVITQSDLDIVLNLLVNFASGTNTLQHFDLEIKVGNYGYKLEKCVITSGTFIIEKLENLKLSISGQATKLLTNVSITTTARTTPRTEQRVSYLNVSIDGGSSELSGITAMSVELQNDIKWTPYETVHDALNVTNASTSMYPSNFTLEKRTLSGSITQYINTSANSNLQTWSTGVNIIIKAGESVSQGVQFNLSSCTFTNRNIVGEVFTQSYDWIMNDNPTNLGSKITFNT